MKKILADIHNAVQNSRDIPAFLEQNSKQIWLHNTPIALLHAASRFEDAALRKSLDALDFFDNEGFSKEHYTQEEIIELQRDVPNAMRFAYLLCVQAAPTHYLFKAKHLHDKYKKIQDDGNFQAFVTTAKFDQEADSKEIETQLRDVMRSAKEIAALKATAFIWIATLPKSTFIGDILEHYFDKNHIYVQKGRKISYIAWNQRLADINMRYFVNTP